MLAEVVGNPKFEAWAGVGSLATAFAVLYLADTIKLLDNRNNSMVESSPSLN